MPTLTNEIDERDRYYASLIAALKESIGSLRTVMDERDRLYLTNFKASEVAVAAALAGSEKAVNAAFLASEKAVLKAEQAQKEYNERSNEFRGQLDDQAKNLMPRTEALTMFHAMEDKVGRMDAVSDAKITSVAITAKNDMVAFQNAYKAAHDLVVTDIAQMREEQAKAGALIAGKDKGIGLSWGVLLGIAGLISIVIGIWAAIGKTGNSIPTVSPQVVYVPAPQGTPSK